MCRYFFPNGGSTVETNQSLYHFRYVGSQHRLYDVIELCSGQRPESSVIRLLEFRSHDIYPTRKGWIQLLRDTVTKHYVQETRLEIRRKTLQVMMEVYKSNRQIYEDELLEGVVLPLLCHNGGLDQVEILLVEQRTHSSCRLFF